MEESLEKNPWSFRGKNHHTDFSGENNVEISEKSLENSMQSVSKSNISRDSLGGAHVDIFLMESIEKNISGNLCSNS